MRVLVTAASRHDATRAIAAAIADGLVRRGIEAETLAIEEVGDLANYDAVVLGSAVYMGRWLRPAVRFACGNGAALATMPVWLFSSGPLGPAGHQVPETEPADVSELLIVTSARAHRLFAGRLRREHLGLAERAIVSVVHAPYGDDRDWEAIDAFAAEIVEGLERPAEGASPSASRSHRPMPAQTETSGHPAP